MVYPSRTCNRTPFDPPDPQNAQTPKTPKSGRKVRKVALLAQKPYLNMLKSIETQELANNDRKTTFFWSKKGQKVHFSWYFRGGPPPKGPVLGCFGHFWALLGTFGGSGRGGPKRGSGRVREGLGGSRRVLSRVSSGTLTIKFSINL